MIAQTMVEYGALHSLSAAFMQAFNRAERFLTTIDPKYYLLLLAAVLVLILTRRRAG